MGFFDLFRRKPTPDSFAKSILTALRRAGDARQWDYNKAEFQLSARSGQSNLMSLCNHFAEHCQLPASERQGHIDRIVRIALTTPMDLPKEFGEAQENLRPKVWLRASLEFTNLRARIHDPESKGITTPQYQIGSHLIASIVYDLPDSMRSVSDDELEEWGVSYYEALEIARENLEKIETAYGKMGDGLYAFLGDNYHSCRLLLPNLISSLEVKGDPVALVPNRDTLLVTGSEDEVGLQAMFGIGRQAIEEPRPMSIVPVWFDGHEWLDWSPEPKSPLYSDFKRAELQFMHGLYDDQKALLEQFNEQNGVDEFVATFSAIEKKDTGELVSYATWSKGIPTSLPVTDQIAFFDPDRKLSAMVLWKNAVSVIGKLMKPTPDYPSRFQVTDFPSDAQFKQMGAELS